MASSTAPRIWREPRSALPQSLALAYAVCGYAGGFAAMCARSWLSTVLGLLLCAHAMVIAAYLLHEAAHQTLFARRAVNRFAGELLSFIAGSCYASFERIQSLHLRHHRERADVTCFDYKAFLRSCPRWVTSAICALEWLHLPSTELLMHAQVIVRPLVSPSQRKYLPRVLVCLTLRGIAFAILAWLAPRALLGYAVAYVLMLLWLDFFDAFHHTYDQYFLTEGARIPDGRARTQAYERDNTYSNVISLSAPWLNLLSLNFGYHNAHHERPGVPWYRLPALHDELVGPARVLPLSELLVTYHRHRVRRVVDDDYGQVGTGPGRADGFVGAHGVSFLSVV